MSSNGARKSVVTSLKRDCLAVRSRSWQQPRLPTVDGLWVNVGVCVVYVYIRRGVWHEICRSVGKFRQHGSETVLQWTSWTSRSSLSLWWTQGRRQWVYNQLFHVTTTHSCSSNSSSSCSSCCSCCSSRCSSCSFQSVSMMNSRMPSVSSQPVVPHNNNTQL